MEISEEGLSGFFAVTMPLLDERQRRLQAAAVLGRGGQARARRTFLLDQNETPVVEHRRGRNAMLSVVVDDGPDAEPKVSLDDICREGARRMLAGALEAEVDEYMASLVDEVDDDGHRLVVRNGHARPRVISTGAGPIEVEAPRVNDKRVDEATGERRKFTSSIIAPWWPKSPKGVRGAAVDVSARDELRRLRAGVG